jgi:hypothetical protein
MERVEAARRLHVAEQDVRKVEPHPDGVVVTLADGTTRLLTEHGWKRYEASAEDLDASGEPKTESEPGVERATDVEVPEGSVREILAWVGDDHERATEALRVEQARETPRKSLVRELEGRVT